MGCDTKGYVATQCKDVMFVSRLVQRTLDRLIRPGLLAEKQAKAGEGGYSYCRLELSPETQGALFNFRFEGEQRMLHLYFDCDCDFAEVAPQSLILSLGCWGNSELYMRAALETLAVLGPVYLDVNDCDSDDAARLEAPTLTYLSACDIGLELPSPATLKKWWRKYQAGELRAGSCKQVLGLSEAEIRKILDSPYEPAVARLQSLMVRSRGRGSKRRAESSVAA